jgi:hypothetical protein
MFSFPLFYSSFMLLDFANLDINTSSPIIEPVGKATRMIRATASIRVLLKIRQFPSVAKLYSRPINGGLFK